MNTSTTFEDEALRLLRRQLIALGPDAKEARKTLAMLKNLRAQPPQLDQTTRS